ncbi:MAG: glutamate racemase [Candidatus Caccovivens sp.]
MIDSGSGGVNILKECVKVCPCANFLLFCDDKNLPYGDKSKDELIELTLQNLRTIVKFFEFDIVILACNTLTSTCIEKCREEFPSVIFIGTEPAVKCAIKEFEPKDILVLATPATLKYNKLVAEETGLQLKAMSTLASDIDNNLDNFSILENKIRNEFVDVSCKAVVLGCTHYLAVKNILQEIFPKVKIFDSANGVARRLKSFVGGGMQNYQVQIMTSRGDDFLSKLIYFYLKE